jgi:hypothetical protein
MRKLISIMGVLLALCGCQQLPPLNFASKDVAQFGDRMDADLKSVSIATAQPDEKRGRLDFARGYSETIPSIWKTALEDAINRSLAFSDDGATKVNLRVKILQFEVPKAGISFTTRVIALYDIQDRNSGKVIFHEEIASDGVVPGNYAFAGVVRATESVNRAVQNNISAFLSVLQQRIEGEKGLRKG